MPTLDLAWPGNKGGMRRLSIINSQNVRKRTQFDGWNSKKGGQIALTAPICVDVDDF